MRSVLVIGIGTGNLDHVTMEAVKALNAVDVFLVADKGEAKRDLVRLREAVCTRYIRNRDYRTIEVPDPRRGPDADRDAAQYDAGVRTWHDRRTDAYAAIIDGLPEDCVVGFLVWGDPAFYDSTLRVVDALKDRMDLACQVIPGISAIQVLAARHGIALNRIGAPIHVTTGRRLPAEYDPSLGDVVVMLDGHLTCGELVQRYPDVTIYWGAYLGSAEEVLICGRLADVIGQLRETRASLRDRHGWIMDTYVLRPSGQVETVESVMTTSGARPGET